MTFTLKNLFGTAKICDCANCTENRDMGADGYSLEARLPCGQYNCWIRLHKQAGFPAGDDTQETKAESKPAKRTGWRNGRPLEKIKQ